MRKILVFTFVFVSFIAFAQNDKGKGSQKGNTPAQTSSTPAQTSTSPVTAPTQTPNTPALDTVELGKKIFIYNASRQYNDPIITRMALYSLLAENPNNVSLRDSLALLYFEQQQYASAALVAQEVANAVPSNMFATEIAAISFERLGVKNKALSFYQKLFLDNSEDLNTLYKMGFLQYDLKLFEEAMNTATQLETHASSKDLKLIFPTADGKGQEVSMVMASLRLKGMIEAAKGNKPKAKEYFNLVLKTVPTFELVKQQLTELDKS